MEPWNISISYLHENLPRKFENDIFSALEIFWFLLAKLT